MAEKDRQEMLRKDLSGKPAMASSLETDVNPIDKAGDRSESFDHQASGATAAVPADAPESTQFAEAGPAGDDLLKSIESLQLAATKGDDQALLETLSKQGQAAQSWLTEAQAAAAEAAQCQADDDVHSQSPADRST